MQVDIVGGGATGVELAAELYNAAAELRHYGLEVFDESRLKVTLIEAGPRILPALPEKLAEAAHEELEVLGVRVITGEQVVEATAEGMLTKSGELIKADLRVWAAGVKGPDMLKNIGLEADAQQPAGGQADPADHARTSASSPSATAPILCRKARRARCRRAPSPRTRWRRPAFTISRP